MKLNERQLKIAVLKVLTIVPLLYKLYNFMVSLKVTWHFLQLFPDPPVVIVRAEEILLVALVLVIWVAAIALFFNRWGKIRMLEPYQPKFQQSHRASCPLSPPTTQVSVQGRAQHQQGRCVCASDVPWAP